MFKLILSSFVINGLENHFEQARYSQFCLLSHQRVNCHRYFFKNVFSRTNYSFFVFLHFKLIMHGCCFRLSLLVKCTFQIPLLHWCCSFIFFLHSFMAIITQKNQPFQLNYFSFFCRHLIIGWLNFSAFHQVQHLFQPSTISWPQSHISNNQTVFKFCLRIKSV